MLWGACGMQAPQVALHRPLPAPFTPYATTNWVPIYFKKTLVHRVLLEATYVLFHRRMTQALVPGVAENDLDNLAREDWQQVCE